MKQHDAFIDKYKEMEKLLPITVREYEDSLPEEEAQKMRLCRLMRNYIQHNADYEKMILIAPGMQAYIDSVVDGLHRQNGILKEHMTSAAKYGFMSESDTIVDCAVMMSKKKRRNNIVLDKNGEYLGVITKDIISDCFGNMGITKITKISKISDFLINAPICKMNQTTPMDIVNSKKDSEEIILAVNTANKIVGVFEERI